MNQIRADRLFTMGKAHKLHGAQHACIEAFCYDSRHAGPGQAFVGVRGEHCDGSSYALAALNHQASVVIIDRKATSEEVEIATAQESAILEVSSAQDFLSHYVAYRLDELNHPLVVGVTGSHGKTSTKELIAGVLGRRYITHATPGNLNSLYGLAHTLLQAPHDVEVLVLEMGMDRLGEIAEQAALVSPTIGVLTNVSSAHINTLGSIERIAEAKFELLAHLKGSKNPNFLVEPLAFLSGDGSFTPLMIERLNKAGIAHREVREDGSARLRVQRAQLNNHGCPQALLMGVNNESIQVTLNLLGMYNLTNALFAAEVGLALGLSLSQIKEGLESVTPPAMRGETFVTSDGVTLIDDSYNANPVSMKAMLTMFGSYRTQGRRIAILGEMKGLGDAQKTYDEHARIGELIATNNWVDHLVCVGDVASAYAQGAQQAGMCPSQLACTSSLDETIAFVSELVMPGDCVIAKASRSEHLDQVIAALKGGASC